VNCFLLKIIINRFNNGDINHTRAQRVLEAIGGPQVHPLHQGKQAGCLRPGFVPEDGTELS